MNLSYLVGKRLIPVMLCELKDFNNFALATSKTDSELLKAQALEAFFWKWVDSLPIDKTSGVGTQLDIWCTQNIAATFSGILRRAIEKSPPALPSSSLWANAKEKFYKTSTVDRVLGSATTRVCAYFPLSASLPDVNLITNKVDYLYVYGAVVSNQPITSAVQLPSIDSIGIANAIKALPKTYKTMLSVGGWNNGDDSQFTKLITSGEVYNAYRITDFANTCVQICAQYGFSGIDIDWQYPDTTKKRQGYLLLINILSNVLHAAGLLLSTTTTIDDSYRSIAPAVIDKPTHVTETDTHPVVSPKIIDLVDFLNVQAYDTEDMKQDYTDTEIAIAYWSKSVANVGKINIGIPTHATDGTPFKTIVQNNPSNSELDSVGNKYYNGTVTVRRKTNTVIDNNFGGIFFSNYLEDVHPDDSGDYSLIRNAKKEVAQWVAPVPQDYNQFLLTANCRVITGLYIAPYGQTIDGVPYEMLIGVPSTSQYSQLTRPLVETTLKNIPNMPKP